MASGGDPWSVLPRLARSDVAAARAALRALAPAPALADDALGPGWRALLGAQVRAAPDVPRAQPVALGPAFTAVFSDARGAALLAVIDRPLARGLAARALSAEPPPEDAPISASEEGALMALCAKAAAIACAPSPPPRLRAVTDDLDGALDALRGTHGPRVWWPWAVSAPPLGGTVTLVLPVAPRAPLPFAPRPSVREARVVVRVIAGRARWPASELAALRAGDGLTLDGLEDARGALRGGVDLALGTPDGPRFSGTLSPDGVRINGPASLPGAPTMDDTMDPQTAPMPRAVLDAIPLEVTVEIARTTATVAEVAMWRAGEVVPLRAPIGGVALVRAGGRAVARGELVDIEGELGVRVTEVL